MKLILRVLALAVYSWPTVGLSQSTVVNPSESEQAPIVELTDGGTLDQSGDAEGNGNGTGDAVQNIPSDSPQTGTSSTILADLPDDTAIKEWDAFTAKLKEVEDWLSEKSSNPMPTAMADWRVLARETSAKRNDLLSLESAIDRRRVAMEDYKNALGIILSKRDDSDLRAELEDAKTSVAALEYFAGELSSKVATYQADQTELDIFVKRLTGHPDTPWTDGTFGDTPIFETVLSAVQGELANARSEVSRKEDRLRNV